MYHIYIQFVGGQAPSGLASVTITKRQVWVICPCLCVGKEPVVSLGITLECATIVILLCAERDQLIPGS